MQPTNTQHCQWIGSEHTGPDYPRCCTAPTVNSSSYCAEHYARVYQIGTATRRRKDARRANNIREIISDLNEIYAELLAENEIDPL